MRGSDGRLLRTYMAGSVPKLNAYLEDYAFLLNALVSLYEATHAPRWIESALSLADVMIEQFWDAAGGGFFLPDAIMSRSLPGPRTRTIARHRRGTRWRCDGLLRLAELTGREELRNTAEEKPLQLFQWLDGKSCRRRPGRCSSPWTSIWARFRNSPWLAILSSTTLVGVLHAIHGGFRPNKVLAVKSSQNGTVDALIPLLAGKKSLGFGDDLISARIHMPNAAGGRGGTGKRVGSV